MTAYKPGDIVLVRFPFTDLSTTKKRPALILNPTVLTSRQGDVVVMAMTSQPQLESRLRVSRWRLCGLPKPTWLKPVIGTFAPALIVRPLGRLHPADFGHARFAIRQAIAPIFLK
jgi:mRNA interferase MazF